jgi:hypothetical protein
MSSILDTAVLVPSASPSISSPYLHNLLHSQERITLSGKFCPRIWQHHFVTSLEREMLQLWTSSNKVSCSYPVELRMPHAAITNICPDSVALIWEYDSQPTPTPADEGLTRFPASGIQSSHRLCSPWSPLALCVSQRCSIEKDE